MPPAPERILILGGTSEARELAASLVAAGAHVISSLAGRVTEPRIPPGEVRLGGFGGVQGLERWLGEQRIDRVVDATHPFATVISKHAEAACAATGVPLTRLDRPAYAPRPEWTYVDDLHEAAAAARGRVLLTTGRLGVVAFARSGADFTIRCITPPAGPLPLRHRLLLERGPFTLAGERELLAGMDQLITKDSGGPAPKLQAARELGVEVIVVRRP